MIFSEKINLIQDCAKEKHKIIDVPIITWVLGFEKDLLKIADPENDAIGIFKDRQRLPKRVRNSQKTDDLVF